MLDYKYKDGGEYESYGDEDDDDLLGLEEGGEDELEVLGKQLSDEQLAKLKEQGITLEEYLNGAGEDLEDDLYGDEGGEDDLYGQEGGPEAGGDKDDDAAAGGAAGDKRAKTD